MKIIASITLSLLASFSWAQTIHIANNNPGAPGGVNVHTSLQAAIDSAVAGDIIQVIPSNVEHPSVTLNKQLTIVGVGFNPPKDIGTRSMLDEIQISSVAANGSVLKGLIIDNSIQIGISATGGTYGNYVIENCRLGRINALSASNSHANIIVRNCIVEAGTSINFRGPQSGIIFSNNIIYTFCCTFQSMTGDGLVMENNIFVYNQNGLTFSSPLQNCTFRKNIFYGSSSAIGNNVNQGGNNFVDNLTYGFDYSGWTDSSFTSGINGNTESNNLLDLDPLFVNFPMSNSWNDSYDPTLQAGSPAIVDVNDRTQDIGPSGGATPFDLDGTNIPLIQSLIAPAVVRKGDDLKVNIRATGN